MDPQIWEPRRGDEGYLQYRFPETPTPLLKGDEEKHFAQIRKRVEEYPLDANLNRYKNILSTGSFAGKNFRTKHGGEIDTALEELDDPLILKLEHIKDLKERFNFIHDVEWENGETTEQIDWSIPFDDTKLTWESEIHDLRLMSEWGLPSAYFKLKEWYDDLRPGLKGPAFFDPDRPTTPGAWDLNIAAALTGASNSLKAALTKPIIGAFWLLHVDLFGQTQTDNGQPFTFVPPLSQAELGTETFWGPISREGDLVNVNGVGTYHYEFYNENRESPTCLYSPTIVGGQVPCPYVYRQWFPVFAYLYLIVQSPVNPELFYDSLGFSDPHTLVGVESWFNYFPEYREQDKPYRPEAE
jgi:hypothetical protein